MSDRADQVVNSSENREGGVQIAENNQNSISNDENQIQNSNARGVDRLQNEELALTNVAPPLPQAALCCLKVKRTSTSTNSEVQVVYYGRQPASLDRLSLPAYAQTQLRQWQQQQRRRRRKTNAGW